MPRNLSNLPPGVSASDEHINPDDEHLQCPKCHAVEIVGMECGTYKRSFIQFIPHHPEVDVEVLPEIETITDEIGRTDITATYYTCQVCGHQWED